MARKLDLLEFDKIGLEQGTGYGSSGSRASVILITAASLAGSSSVAIPASVFWEDHSLGGRLSAENGTFSAFLKRYIARWVGEAGIL